MDIRSLCCTPWTWRACCRGRCWSWPLWCRLSCTRAACSLWSQELPHIFLKSQNSYKINTRMLFIDQTAYNIEDTFAPYSWHTDILTYTACSNTNLVFLDYIGNFNVEFILKFIIDKLIDLIQHQFPFEKLIEWIS